MHTHVILLNVYMCDSVKCIRVILLNAYTVINTYMCDPVKHIYFVIMLNAYLYDYVKCIHV